MIFNAKEIQTKDGRTAILRSAGTADSASLIQFLKVSTAETPYLIREPEEVTLTLEEEENFIRRITESERELMLIATIDGRHVGNCSLASVGSYRRYAHRCQVAIALYREYWGLGLGQQMMQTILKEAEKCGYEQAELEVIADNKNALAMYKKLGFEVYGTLKHDMKYRDGKYADSYSMVKYFTPF